MKRILITGSTGFLGSRLLTHFTQGEMSGKYSVRGVSSQDLDIRSLSAVERLVGDMHPDWVIHCAAISSTSACAADPALSRAVNAEGATHVARACRGAGSKMIFCSSDQVYFGECQGHPGDLSPHSETERLRPQGIYGIHKLEAEMSSTAISGDTVCLRLSWMYDTVQPAGHSRHSDLYTTLRAMSAGDARPFPVNDYRSLTWAMDVVTNMEAALQLPGGIYNFGSGSEMSTWETAQNFMRQIGGREDLVLRDSRAFAGRPRNLRMSGRKAEAHGIHFPGTAQGFETALKPRW